MTKRCDSCVEKNAKWAEIYKGEMYNLCTQCRKTVIEQKKADNNY